MSTLTPEQRDELRAKHAAEHRYRIADDRYSRERDARIAAEAAVQHCWNLDGTFCGAEARPLRITTPEESNAIPVCSPCHKAVTRHQAARAERAEAAVKRVLEMHVPQPHGPGQCDPDGCPDLCQECGERMPCTTRRIICERTTLGAGDWEADPAQVARCYSDKRSQRVQRALDGDA